MIPEIEPLEDLSLRVLSAAAELSSSLPPQTSRTISQLITVTNCYYSNRIEGHSTHPADIERAMRNKFAEDASVRALQREARAHIEVQRLVEERIHSDTPLDISHQDFIRWIHKEFYQRVPEEFRFVRDPTTKKKERVVPGELRHHDVRVGRHYPPPFKDLPSFLQRFDEAYRRDGKQSVRAIVAFSASHHRLMWIHPFSDGNGRVTRLFSHAYAESVGIAGGGFWSISRGLARRRNDYMTYLALADSPRGNNYDGRGALSNAALLQFCEFFLDTCFDQLTYMRTLLDLENLGDRLVSYGKLRAENAAPGPKAVAAPLRPESGFVLREVMLRGEIARGEVSRITGLGRTKAGSITKTLLDEGLLTSDSAKGAVRLGAPSHAVQYFFPQLFPEGVETEFQPTLTA